MNVLLKNIFAICVCTVFLADAVNNLKEIERSSLKSLSFDQKNFCNKIITKFSKETPTLLKIKDEFLKKESEMSSKDFEEYYEEYLEKLSEEDLKKEIAKEFGEDSEDSEDEEEIESTSNTIKKTKDFDDYAFMMNKTQKKIDEKTLYANFLIEKEDEIKKIMDFDESTKLFGDKPLIPYGSALYQLLHHSKETSNDKEKNTKIFNHWYEFCNLLARIKEERKKTQKIIKEQQLIFDKEDEELDNN